MEIFQIFRLVYLNQWMAQMGQTYRDGQIRHKCIYANIVCISKYVYRHYIYIYHIHIHRHQYATHLYTKIVTTLVFKRQQTVLMYGFLKQGSCNTRITGMCHYARLLELLYINYGIGTYNQKISSVVSEKEHYHQHQSSPNGMIQHFMLFKRPNHL